MGLGREVRIFVGSSMFDCSGFGALGQLPGEEDVSGRLGSRRTLATAAPRPTSSLTRVSQATLADAGRGARGTSCTAFATFPVNLKLFQIKEFL